ncbi:MAG TPA: hypothetical protein ENI27_05815 [bacterium]|nr:hypothetical protein [bacterium]
MQLQLALDQVSLEQAVEVVDQLQDLIVIRDQPQKGTGIEQQVHSFSPPKALMTSSGSRRHAAFFGGYVGDKHRKMAVLTPGFKISILSCRLSKWLLTGVFNLSLYSRSRSS